MSIENNYEEFSNVHVARENGWSATSLNSFCLDEAISSHSFKVNAESKSEVAFLDFSSLTELLKPQEGTLLPASGEGKFVSEKVSESVQKRLDELKISGETAEKVLKEINKFGTEPISTLTGLMEKNRVLAIGESHETPNPQRDLGFAAMDSLKKAGATHMAIEAPANIQPQLDEYMKTGKLNEETLPPLLRHDDFLRILEKARANNIKIVAVDENYEYKENNDEAGKIPIRPAFRAEPKPSRDELMADGITRILNADPRNKVIFWVGSMHLANDCPEVAKVAAGLLKDKFSVATVTAIKERERGGSLYPLPEITTDIRIATAVSTEKAKTLGALPTSKFSERDFIDKHQKAWDYVVIYPNDK